MSNKKTPAKTSEKQITIMDLQNDPELALKQDQVLALLNQQPPASWVLTRNDIKYLPIGKVRYLLRRIFRVYRIEVLEIKSMFNGVQATVRLHYLDPVDGWKYQDGVGFSELQTRKDTGVLKPDFSNLGFGAGVKAVPTAKSIALKNAAKEIGELFGASLNPREDQPMAYDFADRYEDIQDIDPEEAMQSSMK